VTVKRYRDVAEMPPPSPGDPADRATYARIKELWRFSSRLVSPLFAPGVYRYRSIEESDTARERATIDRMRAMRAARGR
jgi:hypothetical protein